MVKQRVICGLLLLVSVFNCGESGKNDIVKITDSNWKQTLEGEWLIKFYAPWCPACKAIVPTWTDLSEWSRELNTHIAEVDVTEQPGLSGRFAVTSLPTIYHARDGVFRRYLGPRTKDDLISLLEEQKYLEIDPVPGWQSPNSIAMGILSWVFKMSMLVRVTHSMLTEEYGFPSWSSYGFFAVITVMIGLLLGMVLVLIADCFWPINPPANTRGRNTPVTPADSSETTGKKEEDEEEEKERGSGEGEGNTAGEELKRDEQTVRQRKTDSGQGAADKAT